MSGCLSPSQNTLWRLNSISNVCLGHVSLFHCFPFLEKSSQGSCLGVSPFRFLVGDGSYLYFPASVHPPRNNFLYLHLRIPIPLSIYVITHTFLLSGPGDWLRKSTRSRTCQPESWWDFWRVCETAAASLLLNVVTCALGRPERWRKEATNCRSSCSRIQPYKFFFGLSQFGWPNSANHGRSTSFVKIRWFHLFYMGPRASDTDAMEKRFLSCLVCGSFDMFVFHELDSGFPAARN